jgi:hypothetical protein
MIDYFLTAYDPSDLPGGSVDPLGFDRGYMFLADKILPGLTNVASQPRYFGVLCAGIFLASEGNGETPQALLSKRRDVLLRFERFWALANVLADNGEVLASPRGVSYAKAKAEDIRRSGITRTNAHYQLLSRQPQYGCLGIYGNVADGMRFLNGDSLSLTPDLGHVLAEAFIGGTGLPGVLRRAIIDDLDVSVSTLRDWGDRAHVGRTGDQQEARCLNQALHYNPIRSRMAAWLRRFPTEDNEPELSRLARVRTAINRDKTDEDLSESIEGILAYEACYRSAQLVLERLLWLCRQLPSASLQHSNLHGDDVLKSALSGLTHNVPRLVKILDGGSSERFRENLDRLSDVRVFLENAAANDMETMVDIVLKRHQDVQHGKFDHGRSKMPWLEWVDGKIVMTVARGGGLRSQATEPADIAAHPYRLQAAEALITASLGVKT